MSEYRFLIIISCAAAFLMVGVGMIVPLIPQRVMQMDGSMQSVGYVASIFALSYVLLQLPIGALADKFGARPLLISGYIACGISGLCFFYAQTSSDILLGRLIQGAGEAPVWALGPALLSLAYPHAKGKVIGFYNAAIHAGLTLGPLLGIMLFPSGAGHLPFLTFAGICFCAGITVMLCLPKAPTSRSAGISQAPQLGKLFALFKLRGPAITLLGILIYGAAYGIFTSVLPAYLVLSKGFDNQAVGILFALFYLAISISQLIAGPLSDRYGRKLFMVAGFTIAFAGTLVFDAFTTAWIYLPLTLASFGLGVFCVASMAQLNECVPDSLKASVSGSYYLAWGLGFLLGPYWVVMLAENSIAMMGYYLLALLMLGLAGILSVVSTPAGTEANS